MGLQDQNGPGSHHYQLVLDLIGNPLTTFSLSQEMLCCVLDALEAMCLKCTVLAVTDS